MLFRPGAGSAAPASAGEEGEGGPDGSRRPGGVVFSDEAGEERDLAEVLGEVELDPGLRRMVRQVAERLSVRRSVRRTVRRGPGQPISMRWRDGGDDIDVERTVEALIGRREIDPEEIVVRTPVAPRRAVALVVDASASMKGPKALLASAAVGALCGELAREELTVVAFWKDAAVLSGAGEPRSPDGILRDLVRLRAEGLTNVEVGLRVAARELARSRSRQRAAVLLSDCVHNAGPDPREAARRLPRLHVLLQADGEHDAELGRDLARIGGGRFARVDRAGDVADALNLIFGTSP